MFKSATKTIGGKVSSVPAEGKPAVSGPSEVVIRPRRQWSKGRHLAFSFDETGIQMATAARLGTWRNIVDVRSLELPPDFRDSREDRDKWLAGTIAKYVHEFGRRRPTISVVVSGREAAFRTFLMPALKANDLDAAIAYEVKKQVPFPSHECEYNYRKASRVEQQDRSLFRIALLACTKQLIDRHLAPFRIANIPVLRIHHASDSMGMLLAELPDFRENGNYTLLQVMPSHSEISFYRGVALQFCHICSVGVSQIGKAPDITRLEYFAESLVGEIQVSYDYYTGQSGAGVSNNIIVYGKAASSSDLFTILNAASNLHFRPFPTNKIGSPRAHEEASDSRTLACLPALASSGSPRHLVNLLPAATRRDLTRRACRRTGLLALVLVCVALLGFRAITQLQITVSGKSLVLLERDIAAFKHSEAYQTYLTLKKRLSAEQGYLSRAKSAPSYLGFALKELSLLTPRDIRLNRLDFDPSRPDGTVRIYGSVVSADMPPEITLAEYVESLTASTFYDSVVISHHSKRTTDDGSELKFEIAMEGMM